jgi:pimeloyl-ACP methyl ester carboxylesterase
MRRHLSAALSAILLLMLAGTAASGAAPARDWRQALDELLAAPAGVDAGALVGEVVKASPDWRDVAARLEGVAFPDQVERGVPLLRTVTVADTLTLPWVLVLPPGYDPAVRTPLLVLLHGGVSRAAPEEDPVAYVPEDPFAALAVREGWIALFPFGQVGATWWDEAGMANVRDLVRAVKRECNVDDDRVWLGGFSDGGSAAFLYAMVAPNDYAAFVALNGHMGVGSLDGNLPTYAPNFANTPVYAVTTFDDPLYPSSVMWRTIEMAREAGAQILYRELPGTHDFDYAGEEIPRIAAFLERHPRDPFPTRITWETARPEYGACRWLAIDRVTTGEPEAWHRDFNVALPDETVTIGFFPDETYEGEGVLVGGLPEGDSAARDMRLAPGDVIVAAGDHPVKTMDDIYDYKQTLERGGAVSLTVMRDGRRLILDGELPEPGAYNCFKRELPSALAKVSFSANRVDVQASRVGAFRILVHPDMFRLDRNVVVAVNGVVVRDAPVTPDVGFLLRNFIENRDRRLLYVAEIPVTLE